jgi:hypothetical protein
VASVRPGRPDRPDLVGGEAISIVPGQSIADADDRTHGGRVGRPMFRTGGPTCPPGHGRRDAHPSDRRSPDRARQHHRPVQASPRATARPRPAGHLSFGSTNRWFRASTSVRVSRTPATASVALGHRAHDHRERVGLPLVGTRSDAEPGPRVRTFSPTARWTTGRAAPTSWSCPSTMHGRRRRQIGRSRENPSSRTSRSPWLHRGHPD